MERLRWQLDMGANAVPGKGVEFRVWAPSAQGVEVELYQRDQTIRRELFPEGQGIFSVTVPDVQPGVRYRFRLNRGSCYPDPYSRSQPEGVHGPSEVVYAHAFQWSDHAWPGLDAEGLIIYECHVGTYTPEGTFGALIDQLPEIKRLGVTALEIMPVAEFPGRWNWGYDGVDIYAPTRNYGGVEGLKRLVNAAHACGLGIILDVVYNHLGPDGNYLRAYSPDYFTDRYSTPWGEAFNYDGESSEWVRHYVVQNACYWLNEYHIDGLRLDATHAIYDRSSRHILAEITEKARASVPPERRVVLITENEDNDVRLIRPVSERGYGFDAVWADDFHHAVRTYLTGENDGYYRDYSGSPEAIASVIKSGFLYQGEWSVHRQRHRGTKTSNEPAHSFVFCIQNHDQIGNRAYGDRLNHDVDLSRYSVASALLLLSPETPLLFMGQEFAASSPFLYFTDHKPELGKLVTRGRREEFKAFSAFADPVVRQGIPDPQAESTFRRSKLDLRERNVHSEVYRQYLELISLRKSDPVLARQDRLSLRAEAVLTDLVAVHRWHEEEHRLVIANFGPSVRLRFSDYPFLSSLATRDWSILWHSVAPQSAGGQDLPAMRSIAGVSELQVPATSALVLSSSPQTESPTLRTQKLRG